MLGDYEDRRRRVQQLGDRRASKIKAQLSRRLGQVQIGAFDIGDTRRVLGRPVQKCMREICPEYVDWIRTLPCVMTGTQPVDPSHLLTVGSGGSDFTAVPLNHDLHMEQHGCGFFTFMENHGVDLWPFAFRLVDIWVSMGNDGPRESIELIAERWYAKHGILYE